MRVATAARVEANTAPEINAKNQSVIRRNIEYFTSHPDQVTERLRELDQEWDIERVIQAQSSSLMLLGVILGTTVNRKFLILPAAVGSFLLMHAIQGWCPPVPVLRRLGFRTQLEIDQERCALEGLQVGRESLAPAL